MREAEAFRLLLNYRLHLVDGPELTTGADAGVLVLASAQGHGSENRRFVTLRKNLLNRFTR